MKKLLFFLPFFFNVYIEASCCPQHNHFTFTHLLESIDRKGSQMYPVAQQDDQARIVVVPSGQDEQSQYLIAATYKAIKDQKFDKIFVICSSQVLFHGVALPYIIHEHSYLQNIFIDNNVLQKLSQYTLFHNFQVPFCDNHEMQQQLEFLEFYFEKNVSIIPLAISQLSQNDAFDIAVIIACCSTDRTLIVLSADIAHFYDVTHDMPLDQSKECKIYDQDICKIQAIQSESLNQKNSLFCNSYSSPIFAILFEFLQLPNFENVASDFVGYATSYVDGNENKHDVTSYGAFIFKLNQLFGYKNNIGLYEGSQLLQVARTALQNLFEVHLCRLPTMMSYEMSQSHGLFTSLYGMTDHGTNLRGCMGKVQTKLPLHEMVYQMTQQAACKDLRFYPLRERDLETTIISLSLVTDFTKITDYEKICELDGILLQYDDKEAIALPKNLPIENWNYESSLIDLSEQIGSSRRFLWKKPRAKIFTFHSIIFQED